MLYAIASILFFLWLVSFAFHVLGDYVHLILLLAVASLLIRFIRGTPA